MKLNRKRKGVIVGYAYVVADLFHIGHLKHLQRCKKYCDYLVVGVLTDKATMEKKLKPIIGFKERLAIVENIKCVDMAVKQDTYSPLDNATQPCIDILFESTSHTKEAIKEAKEVMGGRVKVMPYYNKQSSTKIKDKIVYERSKKK